MAQKKEINWTKATAFVGGIDALQIAILFLPPVGEIVDFILDIIVGIGLTVWAWRKGVLDVLGALILGVTFLVELCTDGGAPFWVLDVLALKQRAGGTFGAIAEDTSGALNQGDRREPTGKVIPRYKDGRSQLM